MTPSPATLLLLNARTPDGRVADRTLHSGEPAASGQRVIDCAGRLLTPALADIHLHGDKAYLLDEEDTGATTVAEAIARVRARKLRETAMTVQRRAERLLAACLDAGTTAVRLHAEVDPLLELRALDGVLAAREAFRGRVRVQVVAFAQEGIARAPGTIALLRAALRLGAEVVGGITYQDADTATHLDAVCGLAREFGVQLDLHADFGVAPEATALPLLAAKVREYGLGGLTLIGHCTTLARLPLDRRDALARELADSGVALVALPRTDLYLDGAVAPIEALAACGLPSYLATNNVQNPFTPVGEPSLPAVAQLYALVARLGSRHQLDALACNLWRARAATEPGWREELATDLCLWDCRQSWQIVARGLAPVAVIAGTRVLVDRLEASHVSGV